MDARPFAIRLDSVGQLFWPFDARPVAEREVTEDVRWALLDEWERVRKTKPAALTLFAPAAEREGTDEDAIRVALRRSLTKASGPLRRIDPLSRQDRIAAWIGVLVFFLSVALSTAVDRVSDDVLSDSLSQGILVVGWVALWLPAQRVVVQVVPHLFNKRRFTELAALDVRFDWT